MMGSVEDKEAGGWNCVTEVKKVSSFKQEGMLAVLDSSDTSRGMSTRKQILALTVRLEMIYDLLKEQFSTMIEELARVQKTGS